MSDDDRFDNLFDRFGELAAPAGNVIGMTGKQSYQAIDVAGPGVHTPSLQIAYSNGDLEIMKYNAIASVYFEAGTGALALITRSGALVMLGDHLRTLFEPFQRERVALVRAFIPAQHAPPDNGQAFIRQMGWRSNKQSQERLANQK